METKVYCATVVLMWASFCSIATCDPVRQLRYPRIYNAYITTDKQLQPSKAFPHAAPVLQPALFGPGVYPAPALFGPAAYPAPALFGPDAAQQVEQEPLEQAQEPLEQAQEPQRQDPLEQGQEPQRQEPLEQGQEPQRQEPLEQGQEPLGKQQEPLVQELETQLPTEQQQRAESEPQQLEMESKAAKHFGEPAVSITGEKIYPSARMARPPPPVGAVRMNPSNLAKQGVGRPNYPLTFYPRSVGYYPHPFIPYSYPLAPQPFVFSGGAAPGLGAHNAIYNYPTQVAANFNQQPISFKAAQQSTIEVNAGG